MNFAAIARPSSLRDIPWATWVLLALGGLMLFHLFTQAGGVSLSTLAWVAPVFFAAAVVYAAPPDRRFVWAALALATPAAVLVISNWLPNAWFSIVPGDWKNATPLLMDLANPARDVATVVGLIGLALFGLALGGVRSRMSLLILAFGTLVAAANVVWIGTHPIEGLGAFYSAWSVGNSVLYALGWAFVFAAALESRRRLTIIGTGLLFANVVINLLLLWWPPNGPGDPRLLVYSVPVLAGWALLIAAAPRGELNAASPRSAGEAAT